MTQFFHCSSPSLSHVQTRDSSRRRNASIVIDMHCHMIVPAAEEMARPYLPKSPESAQRFASMKSQAVSKSMAASARPKLVEAASRIADMDAAGIDVQVVSPLQALLLLGRRPN